MPKFYEFSSAFTELSGQAPHNTLNISKVLNDTNTAF